MAVGEESTVISRARKGLYWVEQSRPRKRESGGRRREHKSSPASGMIDASAACGPLDFAGERGRRLRKKKDAFVESRTQDLPLTKRVL
jgi:hypothetical protein